MPSYETVAQLKHIPIRDNGEPLVDFVQAGLRFAPQHPVFPFPRLHLARRGLVERLQQAVTRLPDGWALEIIEGYRLLSVQRLQHEANKRRFLLTHPHLVGEELQAMLEDFSAPPDVPEVPPPHSTGGAVDVYLLDETGQHADMVSPYGNEDTDGAAFDAPGLSDIARRNRSILKEALESAGITNYPAEWWHWSYGDQGWASREGHPCAIYDRLDLTLAEAEAMQGEPADQSTPMRDWPAELPDWDAHI